MTRQMPPNLAALFSSRKFQRSVFALLLISYLDPQPVNRKTLAHFAGIDGETATNYLADLSAFNLIARTGYHDGYILTATGRQLAHPTLLDTPSMTPAEEQPGQESDFPTLENRNPTKESGIPTLPSLVVEVVNLKNKDNLTSTTTSNPGESEIPTLDDHGWPATRRVLELTAMLWPHSPVSLANLPWESLPPEIALDWIAQARKMRYLDAPGGYIHRRLEAWGRDDFQKPKPEGWRSLPDDYLIALGLMLPVPPEDENQEPDDDALGVDPVEPDESVHTILGSSPGSRMDAEQAWQSALGQLQMEMPKASFDAWVRDTRLVTYDDGLFTIEVRNAYARDWLESRLSSTVTRLLMGIANRTVDVAFVISQ